MYYTIKNVFMSFCSNSISEEQNNMKYLLLSIKKSPLLILFFIQLIFIHTIYANTITDEERQSLEEQYADDSSLFDEPYLDNEPIVDDDTSLNNDALSDDKSFAADELYSDAEFIFDDEDSFLSEEPIDESPYIDEYDDDFLFEAPALIFEVPVFEPRSFYDIFPNLTYYEKYEVLSDYGMRNSFEKTDSPILTPNPDSGIDLLSGIMLKNPSHIIEALILLPYEEKEFDMLDIYNALRRIENIKEQQIPLRDGSAINIFVDTTRLESAQRRRPIPDPPFAKTLPLSETM